MPIKFGVDNMLLTWNTMFCAQLDPEKVIGLTRKIDPDGTTIVDASTLQAAAQAAPNACLACIIKGHQW